MGYNRADFYRFIDGGLWGLDPLRQEVSVCESPVEESREFAKKLVQMNHSCRFIELKGKRHAFILFDYRETEEDVINCMQKIEAYLRQILGNE